MSIPQIKRIIVPILGYAILPLPAFAEDKPAPAPAPTLLSELHDALVGGKASVSARYRYEYVDQATFTKQANASTIRTTAGYQTKSFKGLSGLIEFEGIFGVGEDNYRSATNGNTIYPTVLDTPTVEMNQAFGQYSCPEDKWKSVFGFGRKEILLGNQRLVGNVGWRQDHQNFDGAFFSTTPYSADGNSVAIGYNYVNRVNRIVPQDATGGRLDMETHIGSVTATIKDIGQLQLYGLFLDYDAPNAQSSSTVGGRLQGAIKATDKLSVLYGVEYASQSDYGGNPNSYDASYYQIEAGLGFGGFMIKVAYEVLEGDGATKKFTTPLATGHAFNGWADLFLATPNGGLEDTYITISYVPPMAKELKLMAVGHSFSGESISDHYGNELDAVIEYKVPQFKGLLLGAKVAFFDGDETNTIGGASVEEVTKFWAYTQIAF